MAVSSETLAIEYVGSGTAGPFAIPFPFLATGDIRVTTWPVAGEVNSLTVGDDSTVYVLALEVGASVPAIGDVMRDVDGNKGTVTASVDNEDGTADFTISNADAFSPEALAQIFTQVDLEAADFTVTRDADGNGGSLVTDDVIDSPGIVTIFRETALTQPAEFPNAGPFPSSAAETALDRATMQIQELNRRLRELEGISSDSFVSVPGGATELKGLAIFADAAARAVAVPAYLGQIGLQLDTGALYRGTTQTAGAWTETRRRHYDQYRVIPSVTAIGFHDGLYVGTVPADSVVRGVIVAVAVAGVESMDWSIQIGAGGPIVGGVLADTELSMEVDSGLTATTPAGTQIHFGSTNGYSGPDALGLDVFLICDRV